MNIRYQGENVYACLIKLLNLIGIIMKGGGKMEDEEMTLDELKQFIIDWYVNLQRIKKAANGAQNSELEYQLKVTENKLSALGIPAKDYQIE